jgi:hypothetical protein
MIFKKIRFQIWCIFKSYGFKKKLKKILDEVQFILLTETEINNYKLKNSSFNDQTPSFKVHISLRIALNLTPSFFFSL